MAVCLDAANITACEPAYTSLPAPSVTWLVDFSSVLADDGISQTVSLHGFDAVDIGLVTGHWGFTDGDPGWEPTYNIVVNGVIDVADVTAVATCWGWLAPPTQ